MYIIALSIAYLFTGTLAQLNLGTFNLNRNPFGDLQLGFGQGGSLFGYGADRALQVTVGPGRFGTRTDNGVVLGGERVGVDSRLGANEGQGLNLGSILKLGNNGGHSADPLGSLLRNLGALLRPPPNINPRQAIASKGQGSLVPKPDTRSRVRTSLPNPNPTLIPFSGRPTPFPHSPTQGEIDYEDKDEQFPMGVGRGWDGDDRDDLPEEVPETPIPLTPNRIIPPAENGIISPTSKRITTEGNRRGGIEDRSDNMHISEGKHDSGTGQFERSTNKLPVPEGLEMISTSSNKLLKLKKS